MKYYNLYSVIVYMLLNCIYNFINIRERYKKLRRDFEKLKKQYIKIVKENSRLTILNVKYKNIILKKREIDWDDYKELNEML